MVPNHYKDFPLFRVAVQKKEGEEVHVRTIRCEDIKELNTFIKRIYNLIATDHLSLYEVHQVHNDGTGESVTVVIGDATKDWPKYSTIKKHEGIMAPKVPRAGPRELPSPPDDIASQPPASNLPAILQPGGPPKPKGATMMEELRRIAQESLANDNKPDEKGRATKRYKYHLG